MSTINQNAKTPVILERGLGMPPQGPRSLTLWLDFATVVSYDFDYQNMNARNFMSMIQSVFVDNSLNASALSITINGTNQVIKVRANSQGYYTVLVPNPPKMTFATVGAVMVQVILCNFPVPGATWAV